MAHPTAAWRALSDETPPDPLYDTDEWKAWASLPARLQLAVARDELSIEEAILRARGEAE